MRSPRPAPGQPSPADRGHGATRASRVAIASVVATAPILYGAVQPWVRNAYTGTVLLLAAWHAMRGACGRRRRTWPVEALALTFFLGWTATQLIPLPFGLLSLLSPLRAEILGQAAAILERPPAWHPIAYSIQVSLSSWLFLIALAACYGLIRTAFKGREALEYLVRILIAGGAFEALYGILQFLLPDLGPLTLDSAYPGCATGTFINRNHLAGHLEMISLLALGYLCFLYSSPKNGRPLTSPRTGHPGDRHGFAGFMTLLVTLCLLALLLTRSRGGILSVGCGLLSFVLLVFAANRRLPRALFLMSGVLLALIIAYGSVIGLTAVAQRFLYLHEGLTRLAYWQDALPLIAAHPAGIGLGAFDSVFAAYDLTTPPHMALQHLHNDWLQVLVETGWPGLFCLLAGFVAFLGRRVIRLAGAPAAGDSFSMYVGIGAVSGIVAIAIHSFFDFNLQIPANALLLVALLAIFQLTAAGAGTAGKTGAVTA